MLLWAEVQLKQMVHSDKHLTVWTSGVKGQEKVQGSVLKGQGNPLLGVKVEWNDEVSSTGFDPEEILWREMINVNIINDTKTLWSTLKGTISDLNLNKMSEKLCKTEWQVFNTHLIHIPSSYSFLLTFLLINVFWSY